MNEIPEENDLNLADSLCLTISRWCEAHGYVPTREGDGFLYPCAENKMKNEAFRGHVETLARNVFDHLTGEVGRWPGTTGKWIEVMRREMG